MSEVSATELPDRVRIVGKVVIGHRLEECLESSDHSGFNPLPGEHLTRGPRARYYRGGSPSADAGPVSNVRRWLRETSEPIAIENDGLTTCHGIFGNPGMGKTHLLKRMLKETLVQGKSRDDRFGALILDPKGTLVEDVRKAVEEAGRTEDLRLVTTAELLGSRAPEQRKYGMNILDADLSPSEMAMALVLAAQSAVKSASDPYWTNAWINLFMGAAELMQAAGRPLTVANLVDVTIGRSRSGLSPLHVLVADAQKAAANLKDRRDIDNAVDRVQTHQHQKTENAATINVLVATALSEFQRSRFRDAYSSDAPHPDYVDLYDQIIQDGRIVLLSFSKREEAFARMVVTVVKTLFQRNFLCRFERSREVPANVNFKRPVLLMCDEYQEVATELAGRPVGDASFFAQARQSGCLGLLATQSVSGVIQKLPGDAPEAAFDAIISTFASSIFFQSSDPATRQLAISLTGDTEVYVTSTSASFGAEGVSHSHSRQLETRNLVQESQLANLQRGEALVVGSLRNAERQTGRLSPGEAPPSGRTVCFVAVPGDDPNEPKSAAYAEDQP